MHCATAGHHARRWRVQLAGQQSDDPRLQSRDDLYLDGLRDFGSYPRDPSIWSPSRSCWVRPRCCSAAAHGGAINQVTKQPLREQLTSLALNVGSDETCAPLRTCRVPLALFGDTGAFRLERARSRGEVTDRAARNERFGIAPSLTVGIGTDTQTTFELHEAVFGRPPGLRPALARHRPAPVRAITSMDST